MSAGNVVLGTPGRKTKPLKAKKPGTGSYKRRMRAIRDSPTPRTCALCGFALRTRRGWLSCFRHGTAGIVA